MTAKKIKLGSRSLGAGAPLYFIAEAGSNFNQDKSTAKALIDAAAEAKADAVKFQLFRAEALYPDGGELYDIFKSIELSPDWVVELKAHAEAQGIDFLASAFDPASVELLEDVDVCAHKVASSETTNIPLLAKLAATGKPILISTGMCDLADVAMAVEVCEGTGNSDVALLQCTSLYPTEPPDINLAAIPSLAATFDCPVGFSDHSLGIWASIAAAGAGAALIEKHFTLDRSSEGPDHFYALEPGELSELVEFSRNARTALGQSVKRMLPGEREIGRRDGCYAVSAIKAGECITADMLEMRRPATGVRARFEAAVVGATARHDIDADQPIGWSDLDLSGQMAGA